MSNGNLAPTGRLRFIRREVKTETPDGSMKWTHSERVLQQRWEPDVPGYMRGAEGEWRDVETVEEFS